MGFRELNGLPGKPCRPVSRCWFYASAMAQAVTIPAFLSACSRLLNSQPMGFYAPAQILCATRASTEGRGATGLRERSGWDCTMETDPNRATWPLRLGFRQISRRLREEEADWLTEPRAATAYHLRSEDGRGAAPELEAKTLTILARRIAFAALFGIKPPLRSSGRPAELGCPREDALRCFSRRSGRRMGIASDGARSRLPAVDHQMGEAAWGGGGGGVLRC